MTTSPSPSVAVVGDGPAGLAVAAACRDLGLSVAVHGDGRPWHATYATWRDDVADLPDRVFNSVSERVHVVGSRRRVVDRPYAVFDNDALRTHLLGDLEVRPGRVEPAALDAPVVIDATGGAAPPVAWQTAFGVVLPEVPAALDLSHHEVTLMDWRPPHDDVDGAPSFCYVVPVADGWLVEETVLAAAPAVAPELLRDRLVRRLGPGGAELTAGSLRTEQVTIPMGSPPVRSSGRIVAFGAAAGYVHPATGYSVAASLRAAPRVAQAIAAGADVGASVWPKSHLGARNLHDYGLAALLRLDGPQVAAFFDAFFDLPAERWSEYLRVDTTRRQVAGVMAQVFRRAPWRVRARLMAGDPRVLLGRSAAS